MLARANVFPEVAESATHFIYHALDKLLLSTCSGWRMSWVLKLQCQNKTIFWALVHLTFWSGTDRQQMVNVISKPDSRLEGNVCYENRSRTEVPPNLTPRDSLF